MPFLFARRALPVLLLAAAALAPLAAQAQSQSQAQPPAAPGFPLTLENCGQTLHFAAPPRRTVSIGQGTTEILYALGLADRVAATALWIGPVLPQYAEANARIPRLADNDPSFESVIGQDPDLVVVQFEWHVGPRGRVGRREQFTDLGVPTYIAPADCLGKDNSGSGDGVRRQPFDMAMLHQEILDLARIFGVPERGEALVAGLRAREARAAASVAAVRAQGMPVLFWFSSREVKGDAFVAGTMGAPAWMMRALGLRNVVASEEEWPTLGWERLVAAEPALIVLGRMDRRRFPADDAALKRRFLASDPVTSQMRAVREGRLVEMDAQAMNPTLRTVDALEALAGEIRRLGPLPDAARPAAP
ncbi:ABC transporter substrate-binding protein [Pseudoroseomonas cervicalis]|uniref:ABC transporter substrate-binding protein n=1 Tax=Teichococcus cervicalis TaxID=204525 RepID=UPI002787DE47|nr:ABC transporter substrate-binding protein [Pseudoroseomonas cervicalis]MDQ1077832.1 iron complex transport system substrate-binding protein [Pseudoroseomonas cervicalis]